MLSILLKALSLHCNEAKSIIFLYRKFWYTEKLRYIGNFCISVQLKYRDIFSLTVYLTSLVHDSCFSHNISKTKQNTKCEKIYVIILNVFPNELRNIKCFWLPFSFNTYSQLPMRYMKRQNYGPVTFSTHIDRVFVSFFIVCIALNSHFNTVCMYVCSFENAGLSWHKTCMTC